MFKIAWPRSGPFRSGVSGLSQTLRPLAAYRGVVNGTVNIKLQVDDGSGGTAKSSKHLLYHILRIIEVANNGARNADQTVTRLIDSGNHLQPIIGSLVWIIRDHLLLQTESDE
jgi:hypothetical protein